MKEMGGRGLGLILALGAGSFSLSSGALAQELPPRLSLDLSADLRQSDNPDLEVTGGAAQTTTALRFGLAYASVTQDQDFRISIGGALDQDGATDPTLRLSYDRKGANSALGLSLSRTDEPVDLFEPQLLADGTLSYSDLAAATGRIKTTSAGLTLKTGTDSPLGFDLTARVFDRDYSQTNDPSVYDGRSASLGIAAHLRGEGGGDLSLGLQAQRSDDEDSAQTRKDSRSLTLTWSRALDGATGLTASLGVTQAETSGAVLASSSGAVGGLGLTRKMGNGTANLGLDVTRDTKGARMTLRFGRSLKLATGAFGAELAYGGRSGEGAQATGKIAWSQELAMDKISVSLSRQVILRETDADRIQGSLQASWTHALSETRSLGLTYGVNAVAEDAQGNGVTRQSLRASLVQNLGRDWALTAGIELRQSERQSMGAQAAGVASDQAVFLTLARRFVLLP